MGEQRLPRIGAGEAEANPAGADADLGSDFEQPPAQRIALRLRPPGTAECPAPQRLHEGVGRCGEVEAQLIRAHGLGAEPRNAGEERGRASLKLGWRVVPVIVSPEGGW